jgi:hypothetical protein
MNSSNNLSTCWFKTGSFHVKSPNKNDILNRTPSNFDEIWYMYVISSHKIHIPKFQLNRTNGFWDITIFLFCSHFHEKGCGCQNLNYYNSATNAQNGQIFTKKVYLKRVSHNFIKIGGGEV